MNLNLSYVKSVLNIYDEMSKNGISLVYMGEFNQEITKSFTGMTETSMDRKSVQTKVKKRVYHVLVETLQNMNKHSDEIRDNGDKSVGAGLFMIGQKDESYFVITANKIHIDKKDALRDAINEVNNSSIAELKEMYKTQIRDGSISSKGGAGLGLIDIARKTGGKLEYEFLQLDEKHYFFLLKVEVTPS